MIVTRAPLNAQGSGLCACKRTGFLTLAEACDSEQASNREIASVGGASLAMLSDACKCICQWGGAIQVQDPGQTEIEVD